MTTAWNLIGGTPDDFVADVRGALDDAAPGARIMRRVGLVLEVKLAGGRMGRLDLNPAFPRWKALDDRARVQWAEQVVHAALAARAATRVPLIRIEATAARAAAARFAHRSDALVDEPAHPVAEGLAWRLAVDAGDAIFTVSDAWLRARKLARVELEMTAWKNLRADRDRRWTDVGDGLFMAPWEDGNAASRLALGCECAAGLPVAHMAGVRPVFVPVTVEVVFAFSDTDDDALAHVVKHAAEHFTAPSLRPLTTRPYVLGDDGRLTPWSPAAWRTTRDGVALSKIVDDLAHFERACFGGASTVVKTRRDVVGDAAFLLARADGGSLWRGGGSPPR